MSKNEDPHDSISSIHMFIEKRKLQEYKLYITLLWFAYSFSILFFPGTFLTESSAFLSKNIIQFDTIFKVDSQKAIGLEWTVSACTDPKDMTSWGNVNDWVSEKRGNL